MNGQQIEQVRAAVAGGMEASGLGLMAGLGVTVASVAAGQVICRSCALLVVVQTQPGVIPTTIRVRGPLGLLGEARAAMLARAVLARLGGGTFGETGWDTFTRVEVLTAHVAGMGRPEGSPAVHAAAQTIAGGAAARWEA